MTEPTLDQIDRKILGALQINGKTSIASLSDVCGASTASVQRRLRRLRNAGVIEKDTIVVNRKKVGFSIKAIVAVELQRDTATDALDFKKRAVLEPHIQHCYCIAGDGDFVLIVTCRNMAEYEAFTDRFFLANENVRKFRTSIVVSEQKSDNSIPLLA